MIADGVDTFIEIGPGKALSGFVKRIDKTKTILNIEDMASLEKDKRGIKLIIKVLFFFQIELDKYFLKSLTANYN